MYKEKLFRMLTLITSLKVIEIVEIVHLVNNYPKFSYGKQIYVFDKSLLTTRVMKEKQFPETRE